MSLWNVGDWYIFSSFKMIFKSIYPLLFVKVCFLNYSVLPFPYLTLTENFISSHFLNFSDLDVKIKEKIKKMWPNDKPHQYDKKKSLRPIFPNIFIYFYLWEDKFNCNNQSISIFKSENVSMSILSILFFNISVQNFALIWYPEISI